MPLEGLKVEVGDPLTNIEKKSIEVNVIIH
jgi:hypothetical protein